MGEWDLLWGSEEGDAQLGVKQDRGTWHPPTLGSSQNFLIVTWDPANPPLSGISAALGWFLRPLCPRGSWEKFLGLPLRGSVG